MELYRDSKITRTKIESITVKRRKEQRASRIKFSVNGIEFTTCNPFECELDFYKFLISGDHVLCKHLFEDDMANYEEKKNYNVWLDGEYAVFLWIF